MEKSKKKENGTEEIHPEEEAITEYQTTFSIGLHLFLPVAGLIYVLFHQKTLLNRILLQIDRNCVSVLCPSFSRRERLLKWACNRLPLTWSSQSKTLSGGITDLWVDGSLLCTLINTAIPGACPNPHRHWRQPPTHAQAIAYKYFGLVPMFTDEELSNGLTSNLERTFLHYLSELQQVIQKLSEKSYNIENTSAKYVPRGMGLFSGEQHRKVTFYVYQDEKIKSVSDSTVIIQIRGPYGTYGQAVIPRFKDGLFKVPDVKIMTDFVSTTKFKSKTHFMKSFAISFMRYHKKHLGDNIVIDVTMEEDRAKVTYIPRNYGMYEINMVANGELLKGSPFHVNIGKNTSEIEDSFEMEEKISKISTYRKRKIISKTIDFIEGKVSVKKLKEDSIDEKVDKLEKSSDIPKKTVLRFSDVIDEITTNGELFKKNIDENFVEHTENQKYNEETSEKTCNLKMEKDELDDEICRKEHDQTNISTLAEVVEENEMNLNTKTDEKVSHIPSNQIQQEGIPETRTVINEKEEFLNKFIENHETISKTYVPTMNMIKEELIAKISSIQNTKEPEETCHNVEDKYFCGDEFDNYDKCVRDHHDDITKDKATSKHVNTEDIMQSNSHTNLQFRRYSPPNIKLEEYTVRAKINKLKIPDKFIPDKEIDSKDLKNLINSSSKNKFNTFNKIDNFVPEVKLTSNTNIIGCELLNNDNLKSVIKTEEKIDTEITSKEINPNGECIPYREEQPESEPSEYSTSVNVKELLQTYQHIPKEENHINENNIRNLRGKIKHLPAEFNTDHKICNPTVKKSHTGKYQIPVKADHIFDTNIPHTPPEFKAIGNLNEEISQSKPSNLHTSPICSTHIVPEVGYKQMSVAEKRKIFAQPTLEDRTTFSCYSSSEGNDEKNVEISNKRRHLQFEGLSVMNVLGSLKKSENSTKALSHMNSATASLPNISDFPDEYVFPKVVKDKKHFWEEVSSRSSSSLSSTPSFKNRITTKSTSPESMSQKNRKISIRNTISDNNRSMDDLMSEVSNDFSSLQYSTEDESLNYSLPNMSLGSDFSTLMSVKERKFFWEQVCYRSTSSLSIGSLNENSSYNRTQKMKSVWEKPEDSTKNGLGDRTGGLYKSENNILSLESSQYTSLKKYKSVDDSLDSCGFMSVKERKMLLLKKNRFKDQSDSPKTEQSVQQNKKYSHTVMSNRTDNIQKPKNAFTNSSENDKSFTKFTRGNNEIPPSTKQSSSTSHFRKAIKYFQTLESKSHRKPVPEKSKKWPKLRKTSSEMGIHKNRKIGGSLKLPSLSHKFSLSNIYDDVFGSGRNYFRGVPNRSALVEALATFSRTDEIKYYKDDDEDNITFELFKKRMKSKKRKSLKSVFDVSY